MTDQGRSDFCVVFTMNLCALELKHGVDALRSYLKLICEHALHVLPNKKVSAAKYHDKNYIKRKTASGRHLLRNRLLKFFIDTLFLGYPV